MRATFFHCCCRRFVSVSDHKGGRKKKEVQFNCTRTVVIGWKEVFDILYLQLYDRADTGLVKRQCYACLLLVTI